MDTRLFDLREDTMPRVTRSRRSARPVLFAMMTMLAASPAHAAVAAINAALQPGQALRIHWTQAQAPFAGYNSMIVQIRFTAPVNNATYRTSLLDNTGALHATRGMQTATSNITGSVPVFVDASPGGNATLRTAGS